VTWLIGLKLNTDVGERYGVAKRDEISGFLGRLYSGDSGDAKDIPLFMTARLNEFIGVRIHLDTASRNRYPMGRGFVANINHMRLAAGIKMRQFVHTRGFTI
jgi:hypothetical protein